MRRKKVLIIHNVISPHVTPLFQILAKKVDLTVFYCAKSEVNRKWSEKPKGYRFKILPNFSVKIKGKDLFTYFINPTIIKEISKLKPEIVIAAGWDILAYQIAFFYCKLKRIKYVLWSGSTKYEKSWRRVVSKPLVKMIVRNSDACIAYGTRAKEYLESLGAESKKIFISFNTTDINRYRILSGKYRKSKSSIKKKMNLGDKYIIMYYGQLIHRKGVDLLIDAYERVKNQYKVASLLIVGSGTLETEYKRIVYRRKLKDVVFIKDPGDIKVCKYYAISDLFILPSREEVWGLVVNQAMASGLPIVVSDVSGSSADLILEGKNGYTFNSESSKDLCEKISRVLSSRKRSRLMGVKSQGVVKIVNAANTANGFLNSIISF